MSAEGGGPRVQPSVALCNWNIIGSARQCVCKAVLLRNQMHHEDIIINHTYIPNKRSFDQATCSRRSGKKNGPIKPSCSYLTSPCMACMPSSTTATLAFLDNMLSTWAVCTPPYSSSTGNGGISSSCRGTGDLARFLDLYTFISRFPYGEICNMDG